jgi:branched-chain amino acid transport system ATP-binding protein
VDALRVDRLSKHFGGVAVLTDISFAIKVGERVAIIGPNGAGKTTLFNLLNGQLSPSDGRITLFGQNITNLSIDRRARLGLGRSFQVTKLFSNLSVMNNMLLGVNGADPRRFHLFRPMSWHDDAYRQAKTLLEQWSLWGQRETVVRDLAYGDQRKLEMAVTFGTIPKVLLLDEPSNGLTSAEGQDLIQRIRSLGGNVTVILVAHDMDLVFGVAERIIVLHQRGIIRDGPVDQIRADAGVREIYIGDLSNAPMR